MIRDLLKLPRVRLKLIRNLSLDLRDPRQVWRQEFKARRRRECAKVLP